MKTRTASEWRDFWRETGERDLAALLEEYEPHATRVATLLGSRAPREALVAELGRIREHELGLARDDQRDADVAERIHAWFDAA